MTDELIINRETAEGIAEAIKKGLEPTETRKELSGEKFAEKILQGQNYQYQKGLADSKVRTWNLLERNETLFYGGMSEEPGASLENPSIIKLSTLLRKDIEIGKEYLLTCDWYLAEDQVESSLDDWRSPQIGYYFSNISIKINIVHMWNFFTSILGPSSDEETINFSFISNSKKYSSISIYRSWFPIEDGTVIGTLTVHYDDEEIFYWEETGNGYIQDQEYTEICTDYDSLPSQIENSINEGGNAYTSTRSTLNWDLYQKSLSFTLTEELYQNCYLFLYGITIFDGIGYRPGSYVYDEMMVRDSDLIEAPFIKPYLSVDQASKMIIDSIK